MRRWLLFAAVAAWLVAFMSAGLAGERIVELWRSRFGRMPKGLGYEFGANSPLVNPADSTTWMIEGGMVTHLSPTGELLARSPALPAPQTLALNPADGSCWVLGGADGRLLHLSATAKLLSSTPGNYHHASLLTLSPFDGSVWVAGPDYLNVALDTAHVNAAGVEVARWPASSFQVVVNPADGTAWRQDGGAVVCVNADNSQRWRVGGFGTVLHAASTADGSVWVGDDLGRLAHLAGADGQVLFETSGVQPIRGIFPCPGDSSVWVNYNQTADTVWVTTHFAATGDVLSSHGELTMAVNPLDGATLGYEDGAAGQIVLKSRTHAGQSLAAWDTFLYGLPSALDARDNSVWFRQDEEPRAVRHAALTGAWLADLPITRYNYYEKWIDPRDGSCWTPGHHLSATGEDLGPLSVPSALTDAGAARQVLSRLFNPLDGTWWAAVLSYPTPDGPPILSLLHLSADGSELSRFDGLDPDQSTYGLQRDPRDESVWLFTYFPGVWGSHMSFPNGTVWRFAPDGTPLGSQSFDYFLEPTPLLADGSMWVVAHDNTSYRLMHFAASGEVMQEVPLAAGLHVSSLRLDAATGTFYAVGQVDPDTESHVLKLAANGAVLWQNEGPPGGALEVSRDGTLWVMVHGYSYGADLYELFHGSAIYHLDAAGDELSRTEGVNGPSSVTIVQSDGSIWFSDYGNYQLVHAKADRTVFPDVDFDFWARDAIEACYHAGIVQGYTDGSYGPSGTVTRDQMATYIARAMCHGDALVPTPPATATFPDVSPSYWAFRYIEYCRGAGIVQGNADGSYGPSGKLDRAQMAVFLARALCGSEAAVPTGPATATFPDVAPSFWAYDHIEYIASQGVTQGYEDGLYHHEIACPRDQMAVFIARAFHLL